MTSLEPIELVVPDLELPVEVRRLIDDAEERIAAFVARRGDSSLAGFVPSEFEAVAHHLIALSRDHDGCFVEWGAGFGVCACIAALTGFEAHGIEIQPDLVVEAEALAADHGIEAAFVTGTFVPAVHQDLLDHVEGPEWLEHGGHDGHDLLDVEPSDIDVVFAYPWPGEGEVIDRLFARACEAGALLVTWNGLEGIRVVRRI